METIRKVFRFPSKTHDENAVKTIKGSSRYYNDYVANGGPKYDVGMKRLEDKNAFWIRQLETEKTIEERMAILREGYLDISLTGERSEDKSKIKLDDFSEEEQKEILEKSKSSNT